MSLSDKIDTLWIKTEDVKEFIKELKDKVNKEWMMKDRPFEFNDQTVDAIIDQLVGDKLI